MAKKYVVADGFIVNGKMAGEEVSEKDVERIDVLVESGRLIPAKAKSSSTITSEPADPVKEDVIQYG